jgi:hypothetical protein
MDKCRLYKEQPDMLSRNYMTSLGYSLLLLLLSLILLAGCDTQEAETAEEGIHTWLLVRAPDGPLPAGKALTVKSRTEDIINGVSHVELYAVQLPASAERVNLLIRSDAAPFDQTTFTADQTFIPVQPGDYVIKVVGYNQLGQSDESEYISFRVE